MRVGPYNLKFIDQILINFIICFTQLSPFFPDIIKQGCICILSFAVRILSPFILTKPFLCFIDSFFDRQYKIHFTKHKSLNSWNTDSQLGNSSLQNRLLSLLRNNKPFSGNTINSQHETAID